MGRMIKLEKLTWCDDFGGLAIQATTPHAGAYAVLDRAQLGCSDGYGARYAPAHSRSVRPDWHTLGDGFRSVEAAQKRCLEHFSGMPYTPLERGISLPPRVKRKKNRDLVLLGYMSCGTSDEKTKEQGATHE
jgi:hypothetical protein